MRGFLFFFFLCSCAGLAASLYILSLQYDAQIFPASVHRFFPGSAAGGIIIHKTFYILGIPAALAAAAAFLLLCALSLLLVVSGSVPSMFVFVLSVMSWVLSGAEAPYAVLRTLWYDSLPVYTVLYSATAAAAVISIFILKLEKQRDSHIIEKTLKSFCFLREPVCRFNLAVIAFLAVFSAGIILCADTAMSLYDDNTRLFNEETTRSAEKFFAQKIEMGSLPGTPMITGNKNARVRISVFTDPFCPGCLAFYGIEEKLLKIFGKDVGFYHYMLPFDPACNKNVKRELFKGSCDISRMLYTAALKGRFEPALAAHRSKKKTIAEIFKSNGPLEQVYREYFGSDSGAGEFIRTAGSAAVTKRIESDIAFAKSSNITKTPTIFLNGRCFRDSISEEVLNKIISAELNTQR